MKILMVCLGNICRSPLAQGIMELHAPADWCIDSAGTSGWHEDERPDTRSILIAKERGIAIDHQRSRQVNEEDFEPSILFLPWIALIIRISSDWHLMRRQKLRCDLF